MVRRVCLGTSYRPRRAEWRHPVPHDVTPQPVRITSACGRLQAVQARSSHPTVEKTVRVLCDYYRSITSDKPGAEAELFWRNRGR